MYDPALMFTVVIAEKDGPERRATFTESEVTIGRIPGNDVVLPKGNVSKRHSRIVLKDNRFIVVDLKSTNGTYVNGRKITSPLVVKEGDKIYVGDYILTLETAPALDALRPPSMLPRAEENGEPRGPSPSGDSDAVPMVLRGPISHSSIPATTVATGSSGPDRTMDGGEEEPLLPADESELEVFEDRPSHEQARPASGVPGAVFPPPLDPRMQERVEGVGRRTTQETAVHESVLGPLDVVLGDPAVFHVVVERYDRIRADRGTGLNPERASFSSPEELVQVVHDVADHAGVANGSASYDVSLANGLQVVAVLPAAASNGPVMSVRRRPTRVSTLAELAERELAPSALAARMEEAARNKRHVWIVGPSGPELASFAAGALAACPPQDRAALFERAPEIAIGERSVICLKLGAVHVAELLERVRSFRPDRLLMHGLREDDLPAVLDAFAHRAHGNIATFEARSAKDALSAFDRAVGADVTLRAVSLVVELRANSNGGPRSAAAYDLELDASGELALKNI